MSTPRETSGAHNRLSLDALLGHIDEQCRERVAAIDRRVEDAAEEIRRAARDHAAELLREARRRERRLADQRVRAERARQGARIRQRQLELQRERARRGLGALREALAGLWRHPEARAAWLGRALADARVVLSCGDWCVWHPDGWAPDERALRAADEAAPGSTIEWRAAASLACGFVVEAGPARVDATVEGLTARQGRLAGVLLAELPVPVMEVDA
jgi:hypothetical protein